MEQQQTEEKIRAISKVNLEIICRVEQIERTVIYEYDAVVDSSLQVQLVETVRERQGSYTYFFTTIARHNVHF